MNQTTEKNLLKEAIAYGILDMSSIQEQLDMKKKEEIIAVHTQSHSIFRAKDGLWKTYVADETKGRKRVTAKTKEALENKIVQFYREKENDPTVLDLYNQWMIVRLRREEITLQTKQRYDNQAKQCFGEFGNRKIKSIQTYEIEDFILDTIHGCNLTQKGWSNLRTILRGTFREANRQNLVNFRINEVLEDVNISPKLFRKAKKNDDELVYNDEELKALTHYLMGKRDILNLGLILLSKTGLRPGELAALKWQDIKNHAIYVCRSEKHYMNEKTHRQVVFVDDATKTDAGTRTVFIPDQCLWLFEELKNLNPDDEYVFSKNGVRFTYFQFKKRLENIISHHLDMPVKSQNKLRKTYASMLFDSHVPDSVIKSQMGHTDIQTSRDFYYKDRHTSEDKRAIINQVQGL